MKRALLVAALTMAACDSLPAQPGGPQVKVSPTQPTLPIDHPPLSGTGGGSGGTGGSTGGSSGTGGGTATAPLAMGTRRLTVAQLSASLPVVLGGTTWLNGTANGFTSRAATLGVPDYVGITEENLEPSPLYAKFMADAARDACTRVVAADTGKAKSDRVLTRFAEPTDSVATQAAAVNANLRYLKLRFHGAKVAAGDDAPIASYRTLFDSAVKASAGAGAVDANDVKEGWRAVCVALLTAPEYHLY